MYFADVVGDYVITWHMHVSHRFAIDLLSYSGDFNV